SPPCAAYLLSVAPITRVEYAHRPPPAALRRRREGPGRTRVRDPQPARPDQHLRLPATWRERQNRPRAGPYASQSSDSPAVVRAAGLARPVADASPTVVAE